MTAPARRLVWLAALASLASPVGGSGSVQEPAADEIFERAKALADDGDWSAALDLWAQAPDSLPVGASDPRIGPAFIYTALEHGARERLTEASKLYLWSFAGSVPETLTSSVLEEVRRVIPILPRIDSIEWERELEGGDGGVLDTEALAHRVARFWLESDPTPDTPVNERLIEHWERITEARSRFVRHNRSPYGTDDRGTIFVKYGPPEESIGGTLGGSEAEMRVRVTDRLWRLRMRQLDPRPDFALWRYRNLNPTDYTFFLFGNVQGSGPFELVRGPLDLVSNQARALGSRNLTPGGVRGQYYLELFYYHDLSVLGGHYSKRFGELSNLWDGYTLRRNLYGANGRPSPTGPTLEAYSIRFAQEDRYHPPGRPQVRMTSAFAGTSLGTELVVQAVRVLGSDGKPNVVIQSLAAPRMVAGGADRHQLWRAPTRDTRHVLILRDRALREAGRAVRDAPASTGGIAVFRLLHPNQPIHLSVYATPTGGPVAAFDTMSLVGTDHAYFEEPLSANPSQFEMSDIVLGRPLGIGDEYDAYAAASELPFPVLPATQMWPGDMMRFHTELYHLRTGESVGAGYELGFRLVQLDENGEQVSGNPVTIGIPLDGTEPRVARSIDVSLEDFEPGTYRLEVEATDLVTGRTIVRRTEIELLEWS